MSVHYFFHDFIRFEHFEEFLRDRIQGVVDHFIPSGRYNLTTRINMTRKRTGLRKPRFICEVRLDAPQSTTPIVVKKKSSSFYDASLKVSKVLKKVLRRQSSIRAQHGRREHRRVYSKIPKQYSYMVNNI